MYRKHQKTSFEFIEQRITVKTRSINMNMNLKVSLHRERPSAPEYECVCDVPTMRDDYFLFFEALKEEAEEVIRTNPYLSFPNKPPGAKTKSHSNTRHDISAYMAYCSFFQSEFFNLPVDISQQFLSRAWAAYPHKALWELYAFQYNAYERHESFRDWFSKVNKLPYDPDDLFVYYEDRFTRQSVEVELPRGPVRFVQQRF